MSSGYDTKEVIFEPEKQRGCYREAPVCRSRMPRNGLALKSHPIMSKITLYFLPINHFTKPIGRKLPIQIPIQVLK